MDSLMIERIIGCIVLALSGNTESLKIEKAERDRIIAWMNEPCPHTGGLEEQQMYKSDCPKCWQALKEMK